MSDRLFTFLFLCGINLVVLLLILVGWLARDSGGLGVVAVGIPCEMLIFSVSVVEMYNEFKSTPEIE